ncbi:MAG TPA: hypothetical protein VFV35_03620 [Acidimicrobiales bacterium]|nr:hypothetical protein [Acidimicrobiales bacterium]
MRPAVRAWLRALPVERRDEMPRVEVGAGGLVAIRCSGTVHHARVAGGRFVVDEHDPDAETTMMAFGADPPACMVYEAVWDGAARDTFLAEWAFDPDDDRLVKTAEDWRGNFWESWPAEPSAARVLFGPRLQRLLALAVAKSWTHRAGLDGPGSAWADVRRAVTVRARRAVVLSLSSVDAHRRPDALVPVEVSVVPEGEPSIDGVLSRRTSRIELRLPVRWLWDVWSVVGGLSAKRFVLDLDAATGIGSVVEWRATGRTGREHRPEVISRQVR